MQYIHCIPEGKRFVGRPRQKYLDDVENVLKEIGVRGWRKIARDSGAWKLILKEAKVLHGAKSQWRSTYIVRVYNLVSHSKVKNIAVL
jgi:hypothetical protein